MKRPVSRPALAVPLAVILALSTFVAPASASPAPASPVLAASGSAIPAAAAPAPGDPVAIDIVSINDFHGRLEPSTPAAGAAVLGGMVDSFEAANPNTLFVSAGDSLGASTFTSFIQDDQPTIDALNAIGLDASALGNHEFDQGASDLDERILPAVEFPYLAATVYRQGTTTPAYQEYEVTEVAGVSVGFIGGITEELPTLVNPAGIASLEVGSVVDAVNRVSEQLSDGSAGNGEADVLVLLLHEGAASPDVAAATGDSAFGSIVSKVDKNVDAIISGHTHSSYNHSIPIAGTDRSRPVLQSGQYGEAFGHLRLSVDPATGELVDITAEVLPLFGAYPPAADVEAIVAEATAVAAVEGAVKVGEITSDFTRAVQSGGAGENRGGESVLGNFVAEVQQWATADAGAEVALMNPGGLRADLTFASSGEGDPDGTVSFREAASVQPFANTLVTMTLTGKQLKSVLEEQWQPATAARPFLKLGVSSALEYTYDPVGAAGQRVTSIQIDGEPFAEEDTVRVSVNSFLASGGDNFATLTEGSDRTDSGKIDLESMIDYIADHPTVSPDTAQRAVGVTIAPDGPYSPGDDLTVGLSSLLFSGAGPGGADGGRVEVRSGRTVLGSAPIDPAIVNTTDEVGQATVTVTLPDGVAPEVLTVSVPGTGTSVDVPVDVVPAAEPVANTAPPTVRGAARIGRMLTVAVGTWSPADATFAYRWNRDGEPIADAVAERYTVVPADAGAEISVTVVARADGFNDGTATSVAKTIRKAGTTTAGSTTGVVFSADSTVEYTIDVNADELVPVGDVTVYDGGHPIATTVLTEDDEGSTAVVLPELGGGVHILTARFAGSDQLRPSTSWPTLVVVF